jgi:hypothetical protein
MNHMVDTHYKLKEILIPESQEADISESNEVKFKTAEKRQKENFGKNNNKKS